MCIEITNICINVSYVMEFLAWWVLKNKVFTQKSTVVKRNCCTILWIDIGMGLQKLGAILESKVVQKLSLEKNVFNKKWSPKLIALDETFFLKKFSWFLTKKIDFESTILALFEALMLCQFSKYSNFIWIQLIIEQKPCFLGPIKQESPWRNWH